MPCGTPKRVKLMNNGNNINKRFAEVRALEVE